jgi:membrane protease YdiL (CAAX protease family)
MRIKPVWPAAVGVFILYNLVIMGSWQVVGVDYSNLVGETVILRSVVLPLALGALFMGSAVTWMGWWQPCLREKQPARPLWPLLLVLAGMLGFLLINGAAIRWDALSTQHILMLIAAGVLVGFNEELLARGVLVTGLRGSVQGEVKVWFWSSLLFGAMHLPNALFGIPLYAALIQCLFAFLMGGAFYVVRRISGTILLPMLLHGAWDFVTFSGQAAGGMSPSSVLLQLGTYGLGLAAVVGLLRSDGKAPG